MNLVQFDTQSEDPNDYCEECHDTGWGGDHGPGVRGNNEYGPCSCDKEKRAIRKAKRRKR